MSSDRAHLERLVEAAEALLAGEGIDLLSRLQQETDAARAHLGIRPPDTDTASRAAYAAGRGSVPSP